MRLHAKLKDTSTPQTRTPAVRTSSNIASIPFLRFVVLFGVFTGVALSLSATKRAYDWIFVPYLNATASVSAVALRALGESAEADGKLLMSPRNSLRVERGCDGLDPLAMFVAAVVAMPASWKRKLIGVIVGTVALTLINLVRVLSLFYIGVYWPQHFEIVHIEIWQPMFIVMTMLIWIGWASWAIAGRAKHEASNTASVA